MSVYEQAEVKSKVEFREVWVDGQVQKTQRSTTESMKRLKHEDYKNTKITQNAQNYSQTTKKSRQTSNRD